MCERVVLEREGGEGGGGEGREGREEEEGRGGSRREEWRRHYCMILSVV